ncbi:MAG: SMI1/KNR4 family protein [Firmicutes bacterium]|nr:SMI1/KNR4 family protein [Bacillota bacterium]
MNELEWKVARPLVDKTPIEKFEKMIGAIMPNDYVECAVKNNAGYPVQEVFLTESGVEHVFNNLLSFDESKRMNIFKTYESARTVTGNKGLVPFASDSFGNYICFDFASGAKVVFWDHETNKIDPVCSTFTELLAKLK